MAMTKPSYDAEAVVISSMLRNIPCRSKYIDKVQATDFGDPGHRAIFEAMVSLVQNQSSINNETMADYVSSSPLVVKMMVSFLFSNDIPLMDDVTFREFKEDGVRTRLRMMQHYIAEGFKTKKPTTQMLAAMQSMLNRVEGGTLLGISEPSEIVASTIKEINSWVKGDVKVRTGIPEVDQRLFLNQLIGYSLIAGTPSSGKSTLMAQIFRFNAEQGIPCVLFSLEMTKEQLYRKMALSDLRLDGRELNADTLKDEVFVKLYKKCLRKLKRLPFYVIDNVFEIESIYHIARRLSITRKVRLVGLDYIQLVSTSNPKDTELTAISSASKMMKRLSKSDVAKNFPSLATVGLSQYNREEQKRGDKDSRIVIPRNAGMKGSSQLEQDADIILHIIALDSEPTQEEMDGDDWRPPEISKLKLYCGKQREGSRGWVVNANYDKPKQQIITARMMEREDTVRTSRPMEF